MLFEWLVLLKSGLSSMQAVLLFHREAATFAQICPNSLTILFEAQFISFVLVTLAVACKHIMLVYCLYELTLFLPTISILMFFCASMCLPD